MAETYYQKLAATANSVKGRKLAMSKDGKKLTKAQLSHLFSIGTRMSNILYNMEQDERVPADWREHARICVALWDSEISKALEVSRG